MLFSVESVKMNKPAQTSKMEKINGKDRWETRLFRKTLELENPGAWNANRKTYDNKDNATNQT